MNSLHRQLLSMIGGSWQAQAIGVAAALRIADVLDADGVPCQDIARQTGVNEQALRRLLRALCTIDVCSQCDDDRYSLTELGQLLRSDHPRSLRNWAIWWSTQLWQDWGMLLHSVKTGQCARTRTTGAPGFDHLDQDAPAAAVFHQAMVELTRLSAAEVLQFDSFVNDETVVDVGGGYGEFALTILEACPHLRGTIFDQPHVRQLAEETIQQRGMEDRCAFRAGDFFESVPSGADVYLLKSVIHDWEDDTARIVLRNCRRAAGEKGRLLLIERVLPIHFEPSPQHQDIVRSDLTMLVAHGAAERTAEQLHDLIRAAEFHLVRSVSIGMGLTLFEAKPS